MKAGNAIEVRDLTKKFRVYFDKGSSFKEKILFRNRNKYEDRWVLNGVSFDVKKGEAIGLIGHNGCGKSTTLKLLSKIIYPNGGTIEMCGRVSSLIELGAGFHPDMSGRENIYTNAAIFGLTKKEIDERVESIIEFSELRDYIDNPVRTYSSGMYMRLAFSVAINVDADILLIDEILAVGDAHFQEKCFDKLREIKRQGATIVIVSHSLGQIEEICERTIWLDGGKIRQEGIPVEVHPKYMEYMNVQKKIDKNEEKRVQKEQEVANTKEKYEQGGAKIEKIVIWNEKGESQEIFHAGESVKMEIQYKVNACEGTVVSGVDLKKDGWCRVYGTDLKTIPPRDFSLDMKESDYLFYTASIADQAEDYIDRMCMNEKCEMENGAITIHQGGNMWGPYIKATAVNHKLEVRADIEEGRSAVMTVTAECGKTVIRQFALKPGSNKISFKLEKAVENLEFVVNNPEAYDIVIEKILFS